MESNVISFEQKLKEKNAKDTINEIREVAKYYGVKDSIESVTNLKEELTQRRLSTVDEKYIEVLDKKIASLSLDMIHKMSASRINDIYKDEEGNTIDFIIDVDNDRLTEFRRDFLVYMKTSAEAFASIDAQMLEYEKIMSEAQDEIKEIQDKFGDINDFMQNFVREQFEQTEDPEKKEKLGFMVDGYEQATTLQNIADHYSKFSTRNTINDYKTNPGKIYARYAKVVKNLDLKTDLTRFNNIEHRFLEEKYHAYPNLFIFAVMKIIAYSKDVKREKEGLFISQLGVNLRSLYAGSLTDENREKLLNGIRKVLDLFIS